MYIHTMKISVDTKQRIQSLFLFFLEFYKVLMGTYLVVFIPQSCGDHACGITENVYFDSWSHNSILICNSVAFFVILSFYIIEMKREYWCIEYLDVDKDKPNSNLDEEIEHYPEIKGQMGTLNKHYYNVTLASLFVIIANYVISTLYILPNHYGSSTFTSLISFCILVLMKLYSAWNVSYLSIHEEHAYSGYMKTPVTFNVIDENHLMEPVKTDETSNVPIVCQESLQENGSVEDSDEENKNEETNENATTTETEQSVVSQEEVEIGVVE